jgi:hypothetical protein
MRPILLLFVVAFSATAHAQKVVIVTPCLEPGVSEQAAADVMSEISGSFTDRGVQVLATLPVGCAPGRGPAYEECAKRVRDDLGADLVVVTTVSASATAGSSPEIGGASADGDMAVGLAEGGSSTETGVGLDDGETSQVRVALIDGDTSYEGSATFDSIDTIDSIRRMIQKLIERQKRGPGQWIVVRGKPIGAEVRIDERPIGRLPECRSAVEPGVNRITVRHARYAIYSRTIEIADEPGAERSMEVALTPESVDVDQAIETPANETPATETPLPAGGSQAWRPFVGRALIIAGLVLMVPPIIQAVQTGDCAIDDRVRECEKIDSLETYKVVGSVLGGAMIASGIFTLVVEF